MDSAREEVLKIVQQAAAWRVTDLNVGYVKERYDEIVSAATDAIMSAFKRGAGVAVWSDMASAPTDGTVILTDAGTARWQGDYGPDDEGWYLCDAKGAIPSEWGNGSSDYRLQPTMWCEFNPAKRITSAVELSCVVTDEMVEAAWAAFVGAGEDWRDGAVRRRGALDKAALRAALTAALSSRAEEEVRAEVTEEIAAEMSELSAKAEALAEAGTQKRKNDWTAYIFRQHAFVLRSRLRDRSLTNGGE